VLPKMKKGFYVDYDMKSWEVTAKNRYEWGSASDVTLEWQLQAADDLIYLGMDQDDKVEWDISRPLAFRELGDTVRQAIIDTGDPPNEITYQDTVYYLEETGGGQFFKDNTGNGNDFIQWSYEDDTGKRYLTIEQWGEEEFAASLGSPVEEYEFHNILPSPDTGNR
ncbi:DUF4178 domain-containing protein, partial [Desulfobacterales bacterium HSG17]|nr:DUF4178 domain-containing protein [Desulfobacterales bacterium HSG17]